MRQRDFHAGQSALGLMTRNTEAMFAPRMAQWEAFGKGLQDANAIVQNRHAFNEQLAQNQKQNEFKEREFGFREKEAEESKRQFDTQMQENQRQFDQRHALDKQNSSYENKYKESATAYNYWRMGEEQNEKQKSLTLKTSKNIKDLSNGLQLLRQGKELMNESPNIKGVGFGIYRKLNEWSGGYIGLSREENQFIGKFKAFGTAYLEDKHKQNQSSTKIKDFTDFLDEKFADDKQFNYRMAEVNLDKIARMKDDIRGYREMKISEEYLKPIENEIKELESFFEAFAKEKPKGQAIIRVHKPENLVK